jgi:hypothetical protein
MSVTMDIYCIQLTFFFCDEYNISQHGASLVGTVPRLIKATQDVAVPKFQTFRKFARVELRPPNPSEWSEIQKGFGNLVTAAITNIVAQFYGEGGNTQYSSCC